MLHCLGTKLSSQAENNSLRVGAMQKKLYLIPGTMCDERLWSAVKPYLPKAIELVHLPIPAQKSFSEIASYYSALFDSTLAEQEKVSLVGFSLGGYIASYFASLNPDRVDRVFVISNSPTNLPLTEVNERNEVLSFVEQHGYHGISRKRITHLLDDESHTDSQINRFIALISAMDKQLGQQALISQYQHTSIREDLASQLNAACFPIHFYCSERDPLVNAKWFNRLNLTKQIHDVPQDKKSEKRLITTPGSGQMLPLEKPQELAHYLLQWLSI